MKKSVVSFLLSILVGPLLLVGLPCLLASTNILFQNNPSEEDKSDAWTAFVIGISSTACGGWLVLHVQQKIKEQEAEDTTNIILELDSIFLEQIQSNQGDISCISFATAAKISIEGAQEYLDLKSEQLNGKLNVDEDGATLYHFPLPRSLM